MKRALAIVTVVLGLSLAALAAAAAFGPAGALAAAHPDTAGPATAEFLVGLGYAGLMLVPASALVLLVLGLIALVRIARTDASANRAARRSPSSSD
ncbi:hypothetical protein C5E06_17450 [Pseudoclavibacter sp. RFBI5]|uniref:hypothetical protein n=1 Tax=Pseudoclavibacter sp. RFBI5 TaxID=2080578 RepID=UPI000CE7CDDB|nr:hypothetical protein [Pseudoclavibacter sp. RFBI5]PPG01193.1 hypothetical protein C5E06_17450 [Pseudoclavibacter sp. RFBI5]